MYKVCRTWDIGLKISGTWDIRAKICGIWDRRTVGHGTDRLKILGRWRLWPKMVGHGICGLKIAGRGIGLALIHPSPSVARTVMYSGEIGHSESQALPPSGTNTSQQCVPAT